MKFTKALNETTERVRWPLKACMNIFEALYKDKHETLEKVKRSVKRI